VITRESIVLSDKNATLWLIICHDIAWAAQPIGSPRRPKFLEGSSMSVSDSRARVPLPFEGDSSTVISHGELGHDLDRYELISWNQVSIELWLLGKLKSPTIARAVAAPIQKHVMMCGIPIELSGNPWRSHYEERPDPHGILRKESPFVRCFRFSSSF
jgi:hypothetical protein